MAAAFRWPSWCLRSRRWACTSCSSSPHDGSGQHQQRAGTGLRRPDRASCDRRISLDHGESQPQHDADGSAYADAGIELRTISKWSDALLASNSNLNSEDLANHSTSALPTADVPSMGLLTRMYGPAAFRKRDCAWTSSHFMSVRCRTASTTSSVSNLKALNLQFCDQSEASGRPATRSKLVVPDTPNGIPATITMLSPGFPKSPASAASQASFVIDASSVTSFLTTTE